MANLLQNWTNKFLQVAVNNLHIDNYYPLRIELFYRFCQELKPYTFSAAILLNHSHHIKIIIIQNSKMYCYNKTFFFTRKQVDAKKRYIVKEIQENNL